MSFYFIYRLHVERTECFIENNNKVNVTSSETGNDFF